MAWVASGVEYEADKGHAEIICAIVGLVGEAKAVTTPGIKEDIADEQELSGRDSTNYRVLAAISTYLAQDRSDIAFAVKEISRGMARPT